MAAKKRVKPPNPGEPTTFDMTPMIDVTFQLLIFFMLVMDMAKQQTEDLAVPVATRALKEAKQEENIIVVNILGDKPGGDTSRNGIVRVNGKTFDDNALEQLFLKRKMNPIYMEPGSRQWAKYPVLVRADISTHWGHVQKVLMMAAMVGGVTRAELGAKKPDMQ